MPKPMYSQQPKSMIEFKQSFKNEQSVWTVLYRVFEQR